MNAIIFDRFVIEYNHLVTDLIPKSVESILLLLVVSIFGSLLWKRKVRQLFDKFNVLNVDKLFFALVECYCVGTYAFIKKYRLRYFFMNACRKLHNLEYVNNVTFV